MSFDRKNAEEAFERFLMDMDDQVDWLEDEADSRGIELTWTLRDLEALEQLFDLMKRDSPDDVEALEIVFARFLGELAIELYGGRWIIPLDDPKSGNFNIPVVVGHAPIRELEFDPIGIMRSYSLRPQPGLLREALMADISPTFPDLSDLPDED
jgi:hypothetical protein